MQAEDFGFFTELLRARLGIELGVEKTYLVESRLKPLAMTSGFPDVAALMTHMRASRDPRLLDAALDAMTTNETFFFRDGSPFEQFRALLPELVRGRRDPLRIWSAACSTGQEPYSIAMVLEEEEALLGGVRTEILATDVSSRVLEKAKAGVYSTFEVQRGLDSRRLARHFEADPGGFRVKPRLKGGIRWGRQNLLEGFSHLGRFDVIFCRNVLIYFSRENRTSVLNRLADQMTEQGRLYLGAAETPLGLTDRLVSVGAGGGCRLPQPRGAVPLGTAARVS